MPNWTQWLRSAAATPNPAAARSTWMRLDARMGRRAHALARHPNRSRRGGRSPQTPWRGNRGTVPQTEGGERAEPEVGERAVTKMGERTAPTRARGPPPMGSRGRGDTPAGITAATLLQAPAADPAEEDGQHRRSIHAAAPAMAMADPEPPAPPGPPWAMSRVPLHEPPEQGCLTSAQRRAAR
jgi:hypothetical protein